MMALKTWYKQAGGALIACLLMAFVGAPTLDSAVCARDGERPAAVNHAMAAQIASADHHQDKGHDGGSDVCIHGHCHHGSPCVGAEVASNGVSVPVASRTAPPSLGFPPSSPQDRLEEPPRA